jgi:hypothetical protein
MADWWAALSQQHPLPLPAALVAADNSIINVFGVLAFVAHEFKEVNGQMRVLTSVHLACQTARFQLRGWDLEHDTMRLIDSLLTERLGGASASGAYFVLCRAESWRDFGESFGIFILPVHGR